MYTTIFYTLKGENILKKNIHGDKIVSIATITSVYFAVERMLHFCVYQIKCKLNFNVQGANIYTWLAAEAGTCKVGARCMHGGRVKSQDCTNKYRLYSQTI